MKPNIAFLQKVADRKVCNTFSYSPRTGGSYGFRGGEATYEKHQAAGYVNHAPGASLGRPGYVTLTDKGRAALEQTATQTRTAAEEHLEKSKAGNGP